MSIETFYKTTFLVSQSIVFIEMSVVLCLLNDIECSCWSVGCSTIEISKSNSPLQFSHMLYILCILFSSCPLTSFSVSGDRDPGLECCQPPQRSLRPLGQRGQEPLQSGIRGHGEPPPPLRTQKTAVSLAFCVATHPPTTHHTQTFCPVKRTSLQRAMCRAAIVRGSWMSHLHDKRRLFPLSVFIIQTKGKAFRVCGMQKACLGHWSLWAAFIGWETFCVVWISAYRYVVGRLLSVIAIHPEGVRRHLPLELLIRSEKEDEMQMTESQRWLFMLCMLFSLRQDP